MAKQGRWSPKHRHHCRKMHRWSRQNNCDCCDVVEEADSAEEVDSEVAEAEEVVVVAADGVDHREVVPPSLQEVEATPACTLSLAVTTVIPEGTPP